jgi:hypothetical protein
MTGIKRKKTGKKRLGFVAGAVLVMGLAASWLTPCSGMDTLTQSELGELSGQQGISIGFGSAVTVKATFNLLSQGDTDGWGNGTNANAGWLVLVGTGTNTGVLSNSIPEGAIMDIDVGTTGAGTCAIAGGAPYAGIAIPPSTTFFSFSLTKATIGLAYPTTVYVCLTNSATQAVGSMDKVGVINATQLVIDKADMKSTCYIWAH